MSKPVVFVIGASGLIGTYTLVNLSSKYADKVEIRAGVRNPEKADKLKAIPNVTVVKAAQGDSSLVDVLSGVSTLFIVAPNIGNRAQVAISTAESAKQAGVKHIVVVSALIAALPDTIIGGQFAEIESAIAKLGVPFTVVRLAPFKENYFIASGTIKAQGTIDNPLDADTPFKTVASEDAGKALAAVLANPEKHVGKTLFIISNRESYGDFAKAISEALGREIKYVRLPNDVGGKMFLELGFQQWQSDGFLETFRLMEASSPVFAGNEQGDFRSITGEEPTDLKQWVAKNIGFFQ